MKNILSFFVLFSMLFSMPATTKAQIIKLMKGNKVVATYTAEQADVVIFEEELPQPVLDGVFSVSNNKKVQFTRGNLYWNGSTYRFEVNQTDYPKTWNPKHVGHFFWTNITDYQSGNAAYMPYAENYTYSKRSKTDRFFCGEANPLTVEGVSGCFALAKSEWDYIINKRSNAKKLHNFGVKVGDKENCLIVAPDKFTGTLKSSYTLDEINSLGLLCLPSSGFRNDTKLAYAGMWGYYWYSTPNSSWNVSNLSFEHYAVSMDFYIDYVCTDCTNFRSDAFCIRLARLAE